MQLGYDYVDLLEDTTVHLYDLARFFMGDVEQVEAHGIGSQGGRHPYPFRQAAITMKFVSGSVGQFATSAAALSLKPWLRVEVHGDGSWLVVDDVFELTLYDNETGPTKSWRPVLTGTLVFDEEFGGYMNQLEHFLQVLRGEEPALGDGTDGYRALEMVAATHLAIARGVPVQMPLDPAAADREVAAALGRG
jgi:predicted dehydrogenase